MSDDAPAVGSIRLYDSARPNLPSGLYRARSSLVIEPEGGGPGLEAPQLHQTFLRVVAPRFALDPAQIAGRHPAPQASGAFADRLPQIVLTRRTLPWERSEEGSPGRPWLALIVVADGEGILKTGLLTKMLPAGVIEKLIKREPIDGDPQVTVLELGTLETLRGLLPTEGDVPLLSHVRQVNLVDSNLAGTDDDGWFAVVAANRLPVAGAEGTPYLACLVSLEVRDDLFPPTSRTPLLVLHAWKFTSTPTGGSFGGLANALDVQVFGSLGLTPADEVGTVPLQRHDRHGMPSEVRYRGPLKSASAKPLSNQRDDVSRACAFELGRLLGSADARFLREMVAWHRAAELKARVAMNDARIARALASLAGLTSNGEATPDVATLLCDHVADQLATVIPRANLWQTRRPEPDEGLKS